ncbi:MAG: hypothetical protein ACLUNQ_08520 [Oscillospiraceae bacterium]
METVDQVLPVVRSDLGIGFVPREMLLGSPELTGIYPPHPGPADPAPQHLPVPAEESAAEYGRPAAAADAAAG